MLFQDTEEGKDDDFKTMFMKKRQKKNIVFSVS